MNNAEDLALRWGWGGRHNSSLPLPAANSIRPSSSPRSQLECLHGSKEEEEGGQIFKICAAAAARLVNATETSNQFHACFQRRPVPEKNCCCFPAAHIQLTLFFFLASCVFCSGNWHLSQKKSPAIAPPSCSRFNSRLPTTDRGSAEGAGGAGNLKEGTGLHRCKVGEQCRNEASEQPGETEGAGGGERCLRPQLQSAVHVLKKSSVSHHGDDPEVKMK